MEKGKKQQWIFRRYKEWLDYYSNMPSLKTIELEELGSYMKYDLLGLEIALQLHDYKSFWKGRVISFIYKQRTIKKLFKYDKEETSKLLQVLVIWGHCRGPVKDGKDKLQKWCDALHVDQFWTSMLCCHCHSEMVKV